MESINGIKKGNDIDRGRMDFQQRGKKPMQKDLKRGYLKT